MLWFWLLLVHANKQNIIKLTENDDHSRLSYTGITLIGAAVWTADRSDVWVILSSFQWRVHIAFFGRSCFRIRRKDHVATRYNFLARRYDDCVTVISPRYFVDRIAFTLQVSISSFDRYDKCVVWSIYDFSEIVFLARQQKPHQHVYFDVIFFCLNISVNCNKRKPTTKICTHQLCSAIQYNAKYR